MTYRELEIPCYGCEERYVGCHGKCDRYLSFKLKNEEYKKEIFMQKENTLAVVENIRKHARRSGKYLKNKYF